MRISAFFVLILPCFIFFSLIGKEGNLSLPLDRKLSDGNLSNKPVDLPRHSTIDGTLDDTALKLKSKNIEERVGAAKLLGKYPGPQAGLLLIGALEDSSELVRRAGMVSLVEHFHNGSPIYEQPLAEKIFSKIADPDVEVRREVSALTPRLVPGLMRSGIERIQLNGRTLIRSIPRTLREDLRLLAQQALLDSDSIVRQNILKYHYSLRLQIKPETLVKLLEDHDIGVLLVALDQVRMYANQPGILQKMEALTAHPDVGVRSKTAKISLGLGHSFPEYRKVLRLLTQDKVDEIATLAAVDLARMGERVSSGMVDRIILYLSQARGLYGKAEALFYSLSALGPTSARVYQSLLDHPSAGMRAQAWGNHLRISSGWKDPANWIPALNDRDLKVREAVLNQVRGRVEEIQKDHLQLLSAHKFPEVRVLAAEMLLVADKQLVKESFFDLLIDESPLVRSTTLRALANLRTDGWIDLHARSLNDDEFSIQQAAMEGLLGDVKSGAPVLLEYVQKFPSSQISTLAKNELRKMGLMP